MEISLICNQLGERMRERMGEASKRLTCTAIFYFNFSLLGGDKP